MKGTVKYTWVEFERKDDVKITQMYVGNTVLKKRRS